MPLKSVHFRLSDAFLRDLDWLGKEYGGIDRTNTLRVLVAEAKKLKLEEKKHSHGVKRGLLLDE